MELLTSLIIIGIICLAVYLFSIKKDKNTYNPKSGSPPNLKNGDKRDDKHEEIN